MANSRLWSRNGDGGTSLVELSVAVALYAMALGLVGVGVERSVGSEHLALTRDTLLWNLRWAQARAYEQDGFTWLGLQKYSTSYGVYDHWREVGEYSFQPGIQYRDGYLQMPSSRVFYGVMGDSHSAGTIRLVNDAGDERTIVLYMTSGLAVKGELIHDPR